MSLIRNISLHEVHILYSHRMFEDEAHLYLLMEWVEGGELWHHLHNHPGGHFSHEASVFYAAEVLVLLLIWITL